MNIDELTARSRERRRALEVDYARGDVFGNGLRALTGRVLRASGEGLFRLGSALDQRVSEPSLVETRTR